MGRDCNNGNNGSSFLALGFIWTVVPEYAVSAGGIVLRVGLEYLLAICADQGRELVRVKAGMVRAYFQVTEGLPNLLEYRSFRRSTFERCVLLVCYRGKFDFPLHA